MAKVHEHRKKKSHSILISWNQLCFLGKIVGARSVSDAIDSFIAVSGYNHQEQYWEETDPVLKSGLLMEEAIKNIMNGKSR